MKKLKRGSNMDPRANSYLRWKNPCSGIASLKIQIVQVSITSCSKLLIEHGSRHWKVLGQKNIIVHP
jgi:hypothetical protein